MKNLVSRFSKDESGATAIEYGLIAGALAVVIISAMVILSPAITDTFTTIKETMADPL